VKHVFLGIPHGGSVVCGQIRSILQAGLPRGYRLSFLGAGGSLLCRNFNTLWAAALNERAEGRCDLFVMLHSDITPADGWLGKLIKEHAASGADVLSQVMAIKDHRGLSTTGMAEPGKTGVRRLSMREIHILALRKKEKYDSPNPQTFDAADVLDCFPDCAPKTQLVVNTGLWIADFSKPWVEEACFQNLDWIRKNDAGKWEAQAFSEDWLFSQWCNERKIPIKATALFECWHYGHSMFASHTAWGDWERDRGDEAKPEFVVDG
jgi:hypothetical protein